MLTQLLRALSEPLLIEPTMGARLVSVFARKLVQGEKFTGGALHAELGIPAPDSAARETVGKIAVIPIVGVIAQRPQSLGMSTMDVDRMVARAVADPEVIAILYDLDTPGGTVTGVPETAQKIRDAAAVKPSLALSRGLMASAGYWLGAAAGEVWTTPSSEGVGSIGVWTAHEDWTKWLENEGIALTEVTAGKFKTEGAPWKPLTPETLAFLQARVDEVYKWFTEDVAMDRKDTAANVRSGYGEGRVLPGKLAVKAGLADRVGTFEEAIARLTARATPRKRGAKASLLREQLALEASRVEVP